MRQEIVEIQSKIKPKMQKPNVKATSKRITKLNETVLWAIDPNEEDSFQAAKVIKILKVWNLNVRNIIPVTILSPLDMGWPIHITKDFRADLIKRAKGKSALLFKKIHFPAKASVIYVSPRLSLLSAVRKLIRIAAKEKSKMIAVFSRVSTADKLTGLGSFSELLVASSKIPVMVIGRQTEVPAKAKNILFPTDFSLHRKNDFLKVLDWAKRRDAEVILFHQFEVPLSPRAMTLIEDPIQVNWMEAAWEAGQEDDRVRAEKWIQLARAKNVNCRLVLDASLVSWPQRTLEIAQQHRADFIVVSVRRGVWGQTLFGSQIRKLFSQSTWPLIIIHS